MGKINIFFFLVVLFLLPLVLSAPPVTQVQQFTEGYTIETSPTEYIKQNTDFTLNYFLYNISNGLNVGDAGVSCFYYLADSEGNLKYSARPSFSDGYYSLVIKAGNFSEAGHYAYGIRCNSSEFGGTYTSFYEVRLSGLEITTPVSIIYSLFIFILILGFLISVVLAIKIEFKKRGEDNSTSLNELRYFKIFFIVIAYLLLMFIFGITKSLVDRFLVFTDMSGVLNWLYWLMFAGMFPVIVVSALIGFITFLNKKKIDKLLERGIKGR